MANTCKCVPGDDVLLGPNRPGPASHMFDVGEHPVQLRILGLADDAEPCIEVFAVAEVCDETFVSRATRDCCCLTLNCLQQTLIIVEPGRYYVSADAPVEDYVVQALRVETQVTFTMNIGGQCE